MDLSNYNLGTTELNYLGIISRDVLEYVKYNARSTYSFKVVKQSLNVDGIVKNLINAGIFAVVQDLPAKNEKYEDLVVLGITNFGCEVVNVLKSFEEL